MMTIKEYIKQVLSDIREAKNDESSFVDIRGVIDFDIATAIYETGTAKAQVGIMGFGGKVGGEIKSEATSRVRFSIQTKGAISPGERR